MRVSSKVSRGLVEAVDVVGIDRARLMAGFAFDPREPELDWDTFAALLERASELLGGDVERIRGIGRSLVRGPSWTTMQAFARAVVSLPSLYEIGARWIAPASFPHLPLDQTFLGDNRLRARGSIAPPHAPSAPFFHVFEGVLLELPVLLGLPRARLVSSAVSPRSFETVVDIPPSRSLFGRARRSVHALVNARATLEMLEQQREQLEVGLASFQRSTEEIQDLFDRLPDLVVIHREGTILWKNRAVLKTLDYEDADNLVGRPLLDLVAPVSHELVRKRMTGAADRDAPDLIECWLLTREGRSVLVEVSPSQIVRFNGKAARLVVGRDVTERIRLQQQLHTADRMASIGMLAAGVAHEVNNPLAYVLNNVEMAMTALTPLGEATQQSREALGVALEGVAHIRSIVRDLLVLSRVDDHALGPVDVRAVVESTLILAAKTISERALLTCEYHPVPLARGTVSRLGQVLLNLLANAVEAMPAETPEANVLRVLVHTDKSGCAVVEVSDNGVGILPEHAARIFDPFFTTKPFGSGTGLGLAISQRLVAEIGGELTFESTPRRGSTFRLKLAVCD